MNIMLKTNSKKAKDNIWNYLNGFIDIINEELIAYDPEPNYLQEGDRKELANVVYNYYTETFKKNHYKAYTTSDQKLFEDWAQGLTMCGMFDYYAYRDDTNPKKILGDILEETEAERNRYTEDEAAQMLTYLIYREIKREV